MLCSFREHKKQQQQQMRKRLKDRPTTTRGRASNEAQIAETMSRC